MSPTHFAPWSTTPADPFDARKAAHLLRRAGFGASPAEVARAVGEGHEATIEAFFEAADEEDRDFARTFEAIAGSFVNFTVADQTRAWWAYRMVKTRAPLREKLTLFWHGHFATVIEKVDDAELLIRQIDAIRRHASGNFRDLVLAMARDPAMLVWLDGESSTKDHPNENFARELMELFTCGIGHYTEADVQAAARAFTGWSRDGSNFTFKPQDHDTSRKRFLGKTGRFNGDDIVDILTQHPATARNIAAKLLRFFACPEPAPDVVDEAAALLERTRLDVKWFLRELFQSRYFFSEACRRTRIASPVEFAIGTARTLGLRWPALEISEQLALMGQKLLSPPNVKGWDGEKRWINTSSWAARTACARMIAEFEGDTYAAHLDLETLVPGAIREPDAVVARLADVLLQGELGPESRRELAEFLATPDEGQASQAFREDDGARAKKIRACLALILALPEYHAC